MINYFAFFGQSIGTRNIRRSIKCCKDSYYCLVSNKTNRIFHSGTASKALQVSRVSCKFTFYEHQKLDSITFHNSNIACSLGSAKMEYSWRY